MAMRVYELAKKLGIENRVLIPELKKMGVPVTSHSSALDDETVQKVMEKLASKSKGQSSATEDDLTTSMQDATRGKRTTARGHLVEESPKPDKRRILITRKKEDEATEVDYSVPVVENER
jgi:translation initiation factor IF-2